MCARASRSWGPSTRFCLEVLLTWDFEDHGPVPGGDSGGAGAPSACRVCSSALAFGRSGGEGGTASVLSRVRVARQAVQTAVFGSTLMKLSFKKKKKI